MKTLKNGATEIARIEIDQVIVVMAKLVTDHDKWATWRMDPDGDCYWGHYFDTHNEAVKDMLDRV